MNGKKLIAFGMMTAGLTGVFALPAYAAEETGTSVGVDDGSEGGNDPVFTLSAGGTMAFPKLDLSAEPVNGLYVLSTTSSNPIEVNDRRGLEEGSEDLPWRVTASASELKAGGSVTLPTTAFLLTAGTPATASENSVIVNSEVDILGDNANIAQASVGRGKTVFAAAAAKISVAETARKGSYTGTVSYTLVSGL